MIYDIESKSSKPNKTYAYVQFWFENNKRRLKTVIGWHVTAQNEYFNRLKNTIGYSWRLTTNFMAHNLWVINLSCFQPKSKVYLNPKFPVFDLLPNIMTGWSFKFFSKIISEVIETVFAGHHNAWHIPWSKLGHSSAMSSIHLFRIGWIGLYCGPGRPIGDQTERG